MVQVGGPEIVVEYSGSMPFGVNHKLAARAHDKRARDVSQPFHNEIICRIGVHLNVCPTALSRPIVETHAKGRPGRGRFCGPSPSALTRAGCSRANQTDEPFEHAALP